MSANISSDLEEVLAHRAKLVDPEIQRAHAKVYTAIQQLRDEFHADGLEVEEALAILALELISVEYACRHRPAILGKKLAAVPKARERLLKRREAELEERRSALRRESD